MRSLSSGCNPMVVIQVDSYRLIAITLRNLLTYRVPSQKWPVAALFLNLVAA